MRLPKKFYVLFLNALIGAMQVLYAQIHRVEPPFWWSGMHHSTLELLIYGDEIATYQLETSLPLDTLKYTPNNNYLFINLNVKEVAPGTYPLTFTHPQKPTLTIDYTFHGRKPLSANRQGFDASDVIYLLMPDRFANGDPTNDTVATLAEAVDRNKQDGRHGGDLQGVLEHIDYLKALGVTALWMTPLCEDNDVHGSYHTYAQSDLYRIDARFGTNENYKQLSEKLHEQGLKLIMDYVTNHWGLPHWMVQDPPEENFFHQHPSYTSTNHRKEIVSDPYASQKDLEEFWGGWFVPSMPDLNQRHPLLLQYLIQNALWWIEYADLDGLRIDTYPYNYPDAMAQWVQAIRAEYPQINLVGESWVDSTLHSAYWQAESPLAALQNYNAHLPSVMDFSLFRALTHAFKENNVAWDKGTDRLYRSLQNDFLYTNPFNVLVFLENHDTNRINDTYPDFNTYKNALKVLLTLRGIPQLYYGTEIGMTGKKSNGDGDIRRDFPGGWPGDPQNAFDPLQRTARQKQYFNFTQRLLNWRKNAPAIHWGKTLHFVPQNDVYVYFRIYKNQRVMVLVNNHPESQSIDWQDYKEGLGGHAFGRTVETQSKIDFSKPFTLTGQTTLILTFDNPINTTE